MSLYRTLHYCREICCKHSLLDSRFPPALPAFPQHRGAAVHFLFLSVFPSTYDTAHRDIPQLFPYAIKWWKLCPRSSRSINVNSYSPILRSNLCIATNGSNILPRPFLATSRFVFVARGLSMRVISYESKSSNRSESNVFFLFISELCLRVSAEGKCSLANKSSFDFSSIGILLKNINFSTTIYSLVQFWELKENIHYWLMKNS